MDPRILVAGPESRAAYYEPYLKAVSAAAGEPELRWPGPEARADDEHLRMFLRRYQGVLIPGGADLDPALYGERPHRKLGPIDEELDAGQLALARLALKDGWPLLAICRGMQVVGVAVGASLYQDLPSQFSSDVEHCLSNPKDALAHAVEVLDDSRLAEASGAARFEVNSRHHQAVREGPVPGQIGPLRIVAWAPDDVIEAMELPTQQFLVAVQWHPENLALSEHPHAPSVRLFQKFIEACRA